MHQFVSFYSFPFSPYAFVILPVSGSRAISRLVGDSPTQKPDQLVSCQITNAPFSFLTTFYIPKISRSPKQTFSVPMNLLHCQSAGAKPFLDWLGTAQSRNLTSWSAVGYKMHLFFQPAHEAWIALPLFMFSIF